MAFSSLRVGIVGASGYTGGELIRILLHHPDVELSFLYSRRHGGKPLSWLHPDLLGDCEMRLTNEWQPEVDILFLALGHGVSRSFLQHHPLPDSTHIIDLSRDFRPPYADTGFVYGLPEYHRERIQRAERVANPGCFATAIQLALLPLAVNGLLDNDIHVHAVTGSTGAGKSLKETTHFSRRYSNVSIYQPFQHPHLPEIEHTLAQIQPEPSRKIWFIPMRGNFTRGIYASVYTRLSCSGVSSLYREYYAPHPFVHLTSAIPDLKSVINTNKAILYVQESGDRVLVVSVLDNLIKGAAGQAVQNMNLMFGLPETRGLQLKSLGY